MANTKAEVEQEKAKVIDPWQQMEAIKLPKAVNGELNYQIASVNGRVFKIQKGVVVNVPAPIAEVLLHSEQAIEAAELFEESHK